MRDKEAALAATDKIKEAALAAGVKTNQAAVALPPAEKVASAAKAAQ